MSDIGNIIVGQSGGPTTVINSSLYGVIVEAMENKSKIEKIYGMINGIEGFIQGNIIDIHEEMTLGELNLLKHTPAAYLGSCRYKLPESLDEEIYDTIFKKFDEMNIKYFVYIGGNDSMDTVDKLSRYADKIKSDVMVIGVPKTIDNDLIHTDHSPGYGSAAKYVATTVRDIVMDANVYETDSVTIIELMGRHAGWITAASVLARKYKDDNPVLIYLPEVDFDVDDFIDAVKTELTKRNNVIVCVSEGIHDKNGKFICEYESESGTDTFGHKMLTGCGKYLENVVKDRLGVKVRSIELNVNQRCKAILASKTDVNEAVMAGSYGVKAAVNGKTGKMVAFERNDNKEFHKRKGDDEYKIEYSLVDCNLVCNQEKTVPLEWITKEKTGVTEEFIDYVTPLIQGNMDIPTENGLPKYCFRKDRRE